MELVYEFAVVTELREKIIRHPGFESRTALSCHDKSDRTIKSEILGAEETDCTHLHDLARNSCRPFAVRKICKLVFIEPVLRRKSVLSDIRIVRCFDFFFGFVKSPVYRKLHIGLTYEEEHLTKADILQFDRISTLDLDRKACTFRMSRDTDLEPTVDHVALIYRVIEKHLYLVTRVLTPDVEIFITLNDHSVAEDTGKHCSVTHIEPPQEFIY